jgi:anti-sigma factor RsiW
MNTVEEKLWNYIDGSCTPEEQEAIRRLIAQDEVYRRKYDELLALNAEFAAMELEEPPMAFTYNVMEGIRNEAALKPLKARVDKRIIRGIGLFFGLSISVMLIIALGSIHWSAAAAAGSTPVKFTLPNINHYLTGPAMQIFLFFDVVLALYLGDSYLRKKRMQKVDISVQTDGQQTKH